MNRVKYQTKVQRKQRIIQSSEYQNLLISFKLSLSLDLTKISTNDLDILFWATSSYIIKHPFQIFQPAKTATIRMPVGCPFLSP